MDEPSEIATSQPAARDPRRAVGDDAAAASPSRFGLLDQLSTGLIFLTRLPVRHARPMPPDALSRAGWTFPLIGALIGAAGTAAGALGVLAGLGGFPAALLVLLTTVLLTGALHEDGLADTADGFGGGDDAAEKLLIMRDSRIGSYGALALIFSMLLRVGLIGALVEGPAGSLPAALITAHAMARAGLPLLQRLLQPARSTGLAAAAGRPGALVVALALALGLGIAVAAYLGPAGLVPAAAALAGVALVGWLAQRQIGGYTGDVLGAAQQVAEIAALLAAEIMLSLSVEEFE